MSLDKYTISVEVRVLHSSPTHDAPWGGISQNMRG